jgi:hypothetical protein
MSLNPISMYAPLDVSEKIPESLKLKDITASSVVRKRKTVKYVSQNGDTFSYSNAGGASNSSSVITFLVSDSNGYLDPQKSCLNLIFQITEAGSSAVTVPDDAIWAIINRARLECNSVMVEDILQANALTNALIYSACDKSVYEQELSLLAGAWKHNTQLPVQNGVGYVASTSAGSATVALNVPQNSLLVANTQVGVNARAATWNAVCTSGQLSVSIPLSMIFGFHRVTPYFPLRNAGALKYQFFVESLSNCLRSGTAGTPTMTLQKVFISCDILELDPVYVSAMDRIMSSVEDGETGYKLPLNTYLVTDSSWTGSTSHATHNLTFSKSSTQLRSLLFWKRLAGNYNNFSKYTCSEFDRLDQGNPNGTGFQVRIGSDLYPEYGPAQTVSEQYALLCKSFGFLGNMMGGTPQGITNYVNNYLMTAANGAAPARGLDGDHSAFTFGITMDKILDENIDLDGYDSSVNGGIINLQVSDCSADVATGNTAQQVTYTGAIEFSRHLVIARNQVQIIG